MHFVIIFYFVLLRIDNYDGYDNSDDDSDDHEDSEHDYYYDFLISCIVASQDILWVNSDKGKHGDEEKRADCVR